MRPIDWYFDFISPYACLALADVERLTGVEVRYRPILFAALLNHWGHKGPAEMPTKRAWTYRWCTWYAAQRTIRFRMPAAHPFNSLPYLRLAIAVDCRPDRVRRIFEELWTTGADASDPRVAEGLAKSMHAAPDALTAASVKDALRAQTQEAIDKGVFGVPTLVIEEKLAFVATTVGEQHHAAARWIARKKLAFVLAASPGPCGTLLRNPPCRSSRSFRRRP